MKRLFLLCLLALIATVALAEDFWVNKDHMQWTDEEVKKLMTNSPWAKDVTVSAPMAALGRGGPRPAAASGGSTDVENPSAGGGGGRGRGRGGGGGDSGGGGGPSEALVTLNVSWRSALSFRKAIVRSRLGAGSPIPPEARELLSKDQEDYVIVVSGVPAGMARILQSTEQLDKSMLRAGKKAPIAAKSINVQPRTQTVDVIFSFPKTQAITADDKEVEVVLKLGPIEAKRKFSLKEMSYMGKLDL